MSTTKYKIHNHDSEMTLKPMLKEACLKHNVSEGAQVELIANGVKQFSIYSDGSVMPTGFFNSVDQYVEHHKHDRPPTASPSPEITKEQMLVEMARYARTGNVPLYRKCRKQYSECG